MSQKQNVLQLTQQTRSIRVELSPQILAFHLYLWSGKVVITLYKESSRGCPNIRTRILLGLLCCACLGASEKFLKNTFDFLL